MLGAYIFRHTRRFENWEISDLERFSPVFAGGIFSHVTHFDQSWASEKLTDYAGSFTMMARPMTILYSIFDKGICVILLPHDRVVTMVARHTIWPTEIHKAQLLSKGREPEDSPRSRITYVEQSPEIQRTGVSVSL